MSKTERLEVLRRAQVSAPLCRDLDLCTALVERQANLGDPSLDSWSAMQATTAMKSVSVAGFTR